MKVLDLLRDNIKQLKPYSSARDEYSGVEGVFLDANENPLGSVTEKKHYNRYPDPFQVEVKEKLSLIKGVSSDQIFLGNGSDEAIDLLVRAFCEAGKDNIIVLPPTYGMYQVCADIQGVETRKVNLTPETFQIDVKAVLEAVNATTKIIFVCSPNNPTGNVVGRSSIKQLLEGFDGVVVVDEAYIDFTEEESFLSELKNYENLVVLQTFSKAWGLAALRLGMAFAHPELIKVYNKIKYPYNLNQATQELLLEALDNESLKNENVEELNTEREKLAKQLLDLPYVQKIYPSEANFLLVKMDDARGVYESLIKDLVIIRDRSKVVLCDGCVRISIGTKEENLVLMNSLKAL